MPGKSWHYFAQSHFILPSMIFFTGNHEPEEKVVTKRDKIHIIYGGGIRTKEYAKEIKKCADTMVIGNLIYKEPENLLEIAEQIKQNQ
ncbi:MAG: PcrB family [Clostridia bacterium]|jgi:putative glycerol-1-phosphate prenyltransferase|nr:PcrB family [Clostridiales bacterium]MDK2986361.1 PcrB family [Clostridia bacterium]